MVAPAEANHLNVGVLLTLVAALAGEDRTGAIKTVVKLLVADQSDDPAIFLDLTLQ